MKNKYRVLSMFSGCGGMDLGFIKSGFDVVWANDVQIDAINSYKKNIGNNIVNKDITKIPACEMPNNIDVVIGGFPCQGFSISNSKRNINDERNFLYREMLRVIRIKKPKFFVAENVKGILSMCGGKVFEMIKNDFQNLTDENGVRIGYKVDAIVLNSAEYGVPQSRERVFIIGNRLGVENVFPVKTHSLCDCGPSLQKAITTKQAIGFLKDVSLSSNSIDLQSNTIERYLSQKEYSNVKSFFNSINIHSQNINITNHIAYENVADKFFARKYYIDQRELCDYLQYWRKKKNLTIKDIDNFFGYRHTAGHWFRKDGVSGSIPKKNDWLKLKQLLDFDEKYDKKVTTFIEKEITFEQSLRITNWERPSDTITATSPEIHVCKSRRLSARECAILQSFPVDYEFVGSLSSMYRQIGNAVPVMLAKKIAEEIYQKLSKLN